MSTPTRKWQAGDWAFTKAYDRRVKVEEVTSDGLIIRYRGGNAGMYDPDDIRPETFGEYLTRPTGFGLTKWRAVIPRFLFAALCMTVGAINIAGVLPRDHSFQMSAGWGWFLLCFGLGLVALIFGMTWRNFKKLTV